MSPKRCTQNQNIKPKEKVVKMQTIINDKRQYSARATSQTVVKQGKNVFLRDL